MRVAFVGTELAPVRAGAGALETLLAGWAEALAAAGDAVEILGVAGTSVAAARCHVVDGAGGASGLSSILKVVAPDVVVLNNRPGWQRWVDAPTLHLLHNWPDAWGGQGGGAPPIGSAGVAAVSGALAGVAAAAFGRDGASVAVVTPFAGSEMLGVVPAPRRGLVLAPNRLLEKKGVRELVAAARRPALADRRVVLTNYLSPWTSPTAEHLALGNLVRAVPNCSLVPPPVSRRGMAELYARAAVVVVPSIRPEGLGMAAVEAQAVGVPVVSSGLGGLAEATLDPELVVDPGDPDALASAILRAEEIDAAGRARLRAEARQRWSLASSVASLRAALERAAPA